MYTEISVPASRSYKTLNMDHLLNDPLNRFFNDPVPFKPDILQGIFYRYIRADASKIIHIAIGTHEHFNGRSGNDMGFGQHK